MGDGNQEDTDNLSPLNWQPYMGCYHFELNEEPVSWALFLRLWRRRCS